MDKLTKRIRCNPDGSIIMKQRDNGLVIKGKSNTIFESNEGFEKTEVVKKVYDVRWEDGMNTLENTDLLNEDNHFFSQVDIASNGWETEIEYY